MFTVYRCSFGDCDAADGTPLIEKIIKAQSFPVAWSLAYSFFTFFVVVGIFNIISAIYVETIMSSEKNEKQKKMLERMEDRNLWASTATMFLQRVFAHEDLGFATNKLSERVDDLAELQIPRSTIEAVIHHDSVAERALLALDIDPKDRAKLGNILDHNHTGSCTVVDILNGLQRMRGAPRRGDIISVQLVAEGMQEMIEHALDVDVGRYTEREQPTTRVDSEEASLVGI